MSAADTLQKALERIRTVGWRNNGRRECEGDHIVGPLCLLWTMQEVESKSMSRYAGYQIFLELLGVPEAFLPGAVIAAWNDTPGRTQAEVEDLLERAIAIATAPATEPGSQP